MTLYDIVTILLWMAIGVCSYGIMLDRWAAHFNETKQQALKETWGLSLGHAILGPFGFIVVLACRD